MKRALEDVAPEEEGIHQKGECDRKQTCIRLITDHQEAQSGWPPRVPRFSCPPPSPGTLHPGLEPWRTPLSSPEARPIFTPCCLESEAALVLWQEGNLMPLRDGRSTGEER